MKDYILKNVEDDFWVRVKILAATKNITIKELIITLLEEEYQKCLERKQ